MYVSLQSEFVRDHGQSAISGLKTADRVAARAWPTGKFLFREGDEASNVYEVVSGVVRLTRVSENGRRQVIVFGYPGDIIGFPCDGFHHSDCDVVSTAEIISHRASLLEDGRQDPALHHRLLQAALREISLMHDHFMMLGRKSATEKLTSFLAVLADRVGQPVKGGVKVSLPMSRCDIADYLGLTTETISRTFTALRKSGIIRLETSHTVVIQDLGALHESAEGD